MLDPLLRALPPVTQSSKLHYKAGAIIFPVLQMRKLSHKRFNKRPKGKVYGKWDW